MSLNLLAKSNAFAKSIQSTSIVPNARLNRPNGATPPPQRTRLPSVNSMAEKRTFEQAVLAQWKITEFLRSSFETKAIQQEFTAREIQAATQYSPLEETVLKRLLDSQRVEYLSDTQTFRYVAQKSIKDKEDILHMLRDKALDVKIGINLRSDIKDVALPDLRKTVEELASEGKILVVRTNDQNKLPHTIYLNNPEYDTKVDERFTTMWQELRLPPEREMYYDLQQGGHKVSMPVDPIIHDQVDTTKKKKKSQGQRRVKLTNVHLEGIDLSQDYIPNKH